MRKIICNIVIIILVITAIIGGMNIYENRETQKKIEYMFRMDLYEANTKLLFNFTDASEADRVAASRYVSENLHSALRILEITSYNNEKRNLLYSAIYNLYLCMTDPNTQLVIFTEKVDLVNKYLNQIMTDPNNAEACKALSELTNEVFWNK